MNVKVKNAQPVTCDGIKFRSKLEKYCYKKLKEHKIYAEYEQHIFVIQDEFRYDDELVRKITYKPDFVGTGFIIECKGHPNEAWPLRWKLFKRYLFINNIQYKLYTPHNLKEVDKIIEKIKEHCNVYKRK